MSKFTQKRLKMKIDKLLSDIKYILEVAPILMTRANYNKILDIVFYILSIVLVINQSRSLSVIRSQMYRQFLFVKNTFFWRFLVIINCFVMILVIYITLINIINHSSLNISCSFIFPKTISIIFPFYFSFCSISCSSTFFLFKSLTFHAKTQIFEK